MVSRWTPCNTLSPVTSRGSAYGTHTSQLPEGTALAVPGSGPESDADLGTPKGVPSVPRGYPPYARDQRHTSQPRATAVARAVKKSGSAMGPDCRTHASNRSGTCVCADARSMSVTTSTSQTKRTPAGYRADTMRRSRTISKPLTAGRGSMVRSPGGPSAMAGAARIRSNAAATDGSRLSRAGLRSAAAASASTGPDRPVQNGCA
jgi:hypothetical protein